MVDRHDRPRAREHPGRPDLQEARQAQRAGADALVVQGTEAGGHRGGFVDDEHAGGSGLLALLRVIASQAHELAEERPAGEIVRGLGLLPKRSTSRWGGVDLECVVALSLRLFRGLSRGRLEARGAVRAGRGRASRERLSVNCSRPSGLLVLRRSRSPDRVVLAVMARRGRRTWLRAGECRLLDLPSAPGGLGLRFSGAGLTVLLCPAGRHLEVHAVQTPSSGELHPPAHLVKGTPLDSAAALLARYHLRIDRQALVPLMRLPAIEYQLGLTTETRESPSTARLAALLRPAFEHGRPTHTPDGNLRLEAFLYGTPIGAILTLSEDALHLVALTPGTGEQPSSAGS